MGFLWTCLLDGETSAMSPDEAATRAKMKEAGYSEEEIQTMIDAGCTEMAWIFIEKFSPSHYCSVITSAMF